MTPEVKICRHCGESLPLSAFSESKTGRYGVASQCRACKNRIRRERRRHSIKTVQAPPGLRAKIAWSARKAATPPDIIKNHLCPHYAECLAVAARHRPHLDFSCRACEHETDQADAHPRDGELAGMIALLFVLFQPDNKDLSSAVPAIVLEVHGHFGEYLALIAGERPRQQDMPHGYGVV
jgi:hypothetical protein